MSHKIASSERSNEQIEAKAQELLAQLTLDEKIEMMDGDTPFWPGFIAMMSGSYNAQTWDAGVISRLGIEGVLFSDGPRGLVMEGSTTFPVSIARAAAWDVDLEEQVGDVIGRELRAHGGTFFGGVCINLARHPAWGRAQESYGEDPYLLGEMGAALTRGVQRYAMACVKHYALNSMENARFSVDATISPRALHEIYLPHFKRVIDEGVASVMSAYNSVNGEWCGQNKVLLTDILKKRWGFEGFVMTDFMFGMRDAKKAALAGQDIEMPFQMHFHEDLKALVEAGEVPVERLNDAVLRILRMQMRLVKHGDFSADKVSSPSSQALARKVAQESIVLLKNEGNLLPLKDVKKVAVIGWLANTPNTGDSGSSNPRSLYVVTPLEGIQAAFKDAEIVFDDGRDLEKAKATAKAADVVVMVVGYTHIDEGEFMDPETTQSLSVFFPKPSTPEEIALVQNLAQPGAGQSVEFLTGGDRSTLTLHAVDETLIQAVAAANPKTVVAIMGGSSVIIEAWRKQVPAILMLWYPGQEGGHALAEILQGKVNPSGKLPVVVATSPDHLPFYDKNAKTIEYDLWHGYRKLERDGNAPAFPFGFGLSYTSYRYANLVLSHAQAKATDTVQVSLDVTNTGAVAGEEVVQVYVSALGSAVERAPKELKAFARVALQPGQTKKVEISLPVATLAYFDEGQDDFVVEKIAYEVFVGANSLDAQALNARFTVA